jgi:hypothetical protein
MILSKPFDNDKLVNFDPVTGQVTANIDDGLDSGIFDTVAGHNIALYAEDNQLTLQIDNTIWPFTAAALNICQQHSLQQGRTRFDIATANANFTIEYPEVATDRDYLAYIYSIWQSATMQQALLEKWHN